MTLKFRTLCTGIVLTALLLSVGCAGIEPYEPRNHREEGPEKGLFTGSKGAFVISIQPDASDN